MNLQHRNESVILAKPEKNETSLTRKLTKRLIDNVSDEVALINDPEIPGFHLRLGRVRANGFRSKTFYLYYRTKSHPIRSVNYRIGGMPEIDISTARQLALEALMKVRSGIDIQTERKNLNSGNTCNPRIIADLYTDFFERRILSRRKRPEIVQASFKKDILRRIGQIPLCNISRSLLDEEVFQPITQRGARNQAAKTLALMKQFFTHAVDIGCMEDNPLNGVSKSLYAEKYKPRTRTPSVEELRLTFESPLIC